MRHHGLSQVFEVSRGKDLARHGGGRRRGKTVKSDIDLSVNVQILRLSKVGTKLTPQLLIGLGSTYIFRGQGEDSPLKTRLDRNASQTIATHMEGALMKTFKGAAHLYQSNLPDDADYLSWIAFMQHHGIPTRLLDWTTSSLIATFFASEHLPYKNATKSFVIWALDFNWLRNKARLHIQSDADAVLGQPGIFESAFLANPDFFVAPVQPLRMNARQVHQKGLFLCVGNPCQRFQYNLAEMQRKLLADEAHWRASDTRS